MVNFPFIPSVVAFAILLLMWSLRKVFIKLFTKEYQNTFLGDLVLCTLMVFLPSFVLNAFINDSLLVSILVFGLTYELYGFLLYRFEKVESVGALSYFRKRIEHA